jgi:uncharacterized protein YdbL (DUF1318 family)
MGKKKNDDAIYDIANEIAAEREAQVEQWGQQDHPSSQSELDAKRAEKNANHWKGVNDTRVQAGTLTWDGILLEEVWEALAEQDPAARRAELIQVAAVAAAEVEAIDRVFAPSASETCPETGEPCEFGCEADCLLQDEQDDAFDQDA